MKYLKTIILSIFLLNFYNFTSASEVYFVDMKKILNESKAGKGAHDYLKKNIESTNKKLAKEASALKKEETDLIAKKKILSSEDYKKNLNALRKKSIDHQKKRREASNQWMKKKNQARAKLIQAVNPILQKYMTDNKIEIVIDKKDILLANSNFELTDKILELLDKEIKSINLN